MGYAQICPICNGRGKIKEDFHDSYNRGTSEKEKVCHGCLGKGWVDVEIFYPSQPQPTPWYPERWYPTPWKTY
jgi:DnaJ-class molecular chaperone